MTRNRKIVIGIIVFVLLLGFSILVLVNAKLGFISIQKNKDGISSLQVEKSVKLFYYNQELDKDESGNILCSRKGLVPVERKIPITKTPIQDTIQLLISGKLTDEERARGISTEYPLEGLSLKGASLKGASLKDGVLTLEFDDSNNKTVGGACRVGILWFQIEATAKQFPEVQEVRFLPEELFQP